MPLQELSREQFPLTHACLSQALADGVAPGFVAGIWRSSHPSEFKVAALGHRRLEPSRQPLAVDTPFDLSSVTKVMGTATLAAVLVDRGWLSWDLPVAAVFPSYAQRSIQVRHLLSHTAGLPWWLPLWETLRDRFAPLPLHVVAVGRRQQAMRELVLAAAPDAPVGEKAVYSDISFLLLGFLLEEILGLPLDEAIERFVWEPMGVRGAFFRRVDRSVAAGEDPRVAATENSAWRGGVLQGQVHDDNCWAMGGYGGHAGAFARAEDVLQFASRMLGGFLTPSTLNAAWTRVTSPAGCERTLGWDTPSAEGSSVGAHFSKRTVGHLGFTGTSIWIDRDAGLAVTLLSNRVHPTRENTLIRAFRPRFHEAIRLDLRHN